MNVNKVDFLKDLEIHCLNEVDLKSVRVNWLGERYVTLILKEKPQDFTITQLREKALSVFMKQHYLQFCEFSKNKEFKSIDDPDLLQFMEKIALLNFSEVGLFESIWIAFRAAIFSFLIEMHLMNDSSGKQIFDVAYSYLDELNGDLELGLLKQKFKKIQQFFETYNSNSTMYPSEDSLKDARDPFIGFTKGPHARQVLLSISSDNEV